MAANPPLPGPPAALGGGAASTNLATRAPQGAGGPLAPPGSGAGTGAGGPGAAPGANLPMAAGGVAGGAAGGGAMTVRGPDGQLLPAGAAGVAPGVLVPAGGPFGALSGLRGVLQQPAVRRALPAILAALTLFIFLAVYAWMQSPVHRTVMPGMSEADTQAAFESLRSANFNPTLDPQTGQLRVEASRYHEARIHLAAQGIPRGAATGIQSLKEQSSMTTSQFMEQVRYVAAIETELARSIVQIATIQNARVHLALPKQSAFVRDRVAPKASVVVMPYPGRVVSPAQVRAIVHLVSSSVPYLAAEHVSIIDDAGRLLTESSAEQALGLTSAQTEHKRQIEEVYRARILQLLAPIVGEDNVRTQVNLVMDFTQEESTFEDFDRRAQGPRTRSEVLAEDRTQRLNPAGVPGALSNTPPPDATFNTDGKATDENTNRAETVSTRTTRNYELDRTVRHVRSQSGVIQRVSVSVVINDRNRAAANGAGAANGEAGSKPEGAEGAAAAQNGSGYTQQEIDRLVELVRGVVGFDSARGDMVTLMPARFEPPTPMEPAMPWYESQMLMDAIKSAVAALVFLIILLVVVRPVMRSFMAPAGGAAGAEGGAAGGAAGGAGGAEGNKEGGEDGMIELGEGETLEDIKARLKPRKSTISADMLDTANTYDDKVAVIRMLVADDAGRVANVLKGMVKAV